MQLPKKGIQNVERKFQEVPLLHSFKTYFKQRIYQEFHRRHASLKFGSQHLQLVLQKLKIKDFTN
jgi:hypothetical protein